MFTEHFISKMLKYFISFYFAFCYSALKYHGYVQDQRGENSESTFIDSLHSHRSRRNVDGNTTYCSSINCTEKVSHLSPYLNDISVKCQEL